MANLDISERRLPQDGRIDYNYLSRVINIRVSSLPTIFGEKFVLRILDKEQFNYSLDMLFPIIEYQKIIKEICKNKAGLVLITGPTGSGKTTTLYSIIKYLNTQSKNIITIEDPVEYLVEGVNQVQVNNKIKLTFENGLRSILRQDPDVIIIGEIRDRQTAKIAINAAITGHLVLATLHCKNCIDGVFRLSSLGINEIDISTSILSIISQRLIKDNKKGRVAIYELLEMNHKSREAIKKGLLNIEDLSISFDTYYKKMKEISVL